MSGLLLTRTFVTLQTVDDIEISDLPTTVQPLAELIGVPAILKLIERYGGQTVYFPFAPNPGNDLVQLIGLGASRKIVKLIGTSEIGGAKFHLPLARSLRKKVRDLEIIQDKRAGVSESDLARRYKMDTRSIRRIIKKGKAQ